MLVMLTKVYTYTAIQLRERANSKLRINSHGVDIFIERAFAHNWSFTKWLFDNIADEVWSNVAMHLNIYLSDMYDYLYWHASTIEEIAITRDSISESRICDRIAPQRRLYICAVRAWVSVALNQYNIVWHTTNDTWLTMRIALVEKQQQQNGAMRWKERTSERHKVNGSNQMVKKRQKCAYHMISIFNTCVGAITLQAK